MYCKETRWQACLVWYGLFVRSSYSSQRLQVRTKQKCSYICVVTTENVLLDTCALRRFRLRKNHHWAHFGWPIMQSFFIRWVHMSEIFLWTLAPSEDSDQTAHSRSLIRILTGHSLDGQECKFSSYVWCASQKVWILTLRLVFTASIYK